MQKRPNDEKNTVSAGERRRVGVSVHENEYRRNHPRKVSGVAANERNEY
jgi:hypothetical protein